MIPCKLEFLNRPVILKDRVTGTFTFLGIYRGSDDECVLLWHPIHGDFTTKNDGFLLVAGS